MSDSNEEGRFQIGPIGAEGDTHSPITRVYLGECRKCPRMVMAWLRGPDGDDGWGYRPIGKCGNPDRCGDKQPHPFDNDPGGPL